MVFFVLLVFSMLLEIIVGFNFSLISFIIEWICIFFEFVNGILLGYMIMYQRSIEVGSFQNVLIEFKFGEFFKNIIDLFVYIEYCVCVVGRMRIGIGNWSECFNIIIDEEGKVIVKQ